MKKVNLILVISVVFMIMTVTGCKQKQFYGWTPPISGLHWGMSEAGVIKAMDLKAKDFVREEEGVIVLVTTKKEYNLYGSKTNMLLSFYNDSLTRISATIRDDDIDLVDQRLTQELGEGDYRYSINAGASDKDVVSVYRRDTYVKEDPELYELIKKIYLDADFDLIKGIIPLKDSLGELPLTTCEFNLDTFGTTYGLLTIDGRIAATLNCPKMFTKRD